jgi:hypothetical protein
MTAPAPSAEPRPTPWLTFVASTLLAVTFGGAPALVSWGVLSSQVSDLRTEVSDLRSWKGEASVTLERLRTELGFLHDDMADVKAGVGDIRAALGIGRGVQPAVSRPRP